MCVCVCVSLGTLSLKRIEIHNNITCGIIIRYDIETRGKYYFMIIYHYYNYSGKSSLPARMRIL